MLLAAVFFFEGLAVSYVLRGGGALPYVHALRKNGLGQFGDPTMDPTGAAPPLPASAPWWATLIQSTAVPIARGTASRIAYGTSPPPPSSFFYQTPYGGYSGGAYGGFQPSTLLLLGGAAILVLSMMRGK